MLEVTVWGLRHLVFARRTHHGWNDSDYIDRVSPAWGGGYTLLQNIQTGIQDPLIKLRNRGRDGRRKRSIDNDRNKLVGSDLLRPHFPITWLTIFMFLHLSIVPRSWTNLVLCAVVEPSNIIQDILILLIAIVHVHCVIWRRGRERLNPVVQKENNSIVWCHQPEMRVKTMESLWAYTVRK